MEVYKTLCCVIFQSLAIVTVRWKALYSHTDSGLADKTKYPTMATCTY